MLNERLQTIKEKILKLKEKDTFLSVFGANDDQYSQTGGHHYEMRPVLTEEMVKGMEDIMGIRFPEEYREFLKQISNGGVGPFWGLYPLEYAVPPPEYHKQNPDFCKTPFPYNQADADRILTIQKEQDIQYAEPIDRPLSGYIKLSNYGHAMYFILIVSGDQAGKVWFLNEEGAVSPLCDAQGRLMTFLDWYEKWLDDNLEQGAIPDNPDLPFNNPDSIYAVNYKRLGLTEVPKHVFVCKNLQKLLIDENKLTALPPEIGNLEQLNTLSAFFNQITQIPEEFGKLKNLQQVYFKTNAIEALPESIGNCENLALIDLSFNRLKKLPESIGNLPKLQYIDLSYNQLETLPESFKNLTNLQQLVLTGNPLSDEEKAKIQAMFPHTAITL